MCWLGGKKHLLRQVIIHCSLFQTLDRYQPSSGLPGTSRVLCHWMRIVEFLDYAE